MKKILTLFLTFLIGLIGSFLYAQSQPTAWRLTINDTISPAMEEYLAQGIKDAQEADASLIIVHLDTPGGIVSAMRSMVQAMSQSSIPIVTYVSPSGAHAASAGTFLLYASHVAAMSPGTNLGAATPISMGQQNEQQSPALTKATQDLLALIRSQAQKHQRDPNQWYEEAVLNGASISSQDALKQGIIEIQAQDEDDLLEQLDGRTVHLNGQPQTLNTQNIKVLDSPPNWRIQILAIITNPNIAYGLLMLGIYGILFELYHPGTFISGIIGLIALALAAYGLHLLPVNDAGLALLVLGVALLAGELYITGFGLLGIAGSIAFLLGSLLLFNPTLSGWGLSHWVIGSFTVSTVILISAMAALLWKLHRKKHVTGMNCLINQIGIITHTTENYLEVRVSGERWQAKTKTACAVGQKVQIESINGLILTVKPIKNVKNPR